MSSFCKDLRDAAMKCPDILIRKMCQDIADEIGMNIALLNIHMTSQNMRDLNASWVRGVNILAKAQPTPGTTPRSGAGTIEQERIAA